MATKTTAVERRKPSTLELLKGDQFSQRLQAIASDLIDSDKFRAACIMVFQRTPKLAFCEPGEVVRAMLDSAQCGLIPDGRYAHLVPFKKQCQFIPDWKGLVMLGMRSPEVKRWRTDVVRANDEFSFNKGVIETHRIDYSKDRGRVIGYYSEVLYQDGTEDAEFVTLEEAKAVQKRSAAGKDGPWITDFDEMGRKTPCKKQAKRLGHILTKEFNLAMEKDADQLPRDVTGDIISIDEASASATDKIRAMEEESTGATAGGEEATEPVGTGPSESQGPDEDPADEPPGKEPSEPGSTSEEGASEPEQAPDSEGSDDDDEDKAERDRCLGVISAHLAGMKSVIRRKEWAKQYNTSPGEYVKMDLTALQVMAAEIEGGD